MGTRLKKRKKCTLGDLWKHFSLGTALDEPSITKMGPSREITRKMLVELEKAGNEWSALAAYAKAQGWVERRAVQIGEERDYVVQLNGRQLTLRIPVDPLRVTRGDVLRAQFKANTIVIRKAS